MLMFKILRNVSYNYEKSLSGNAYAELPHLILNQCQTILILLSKLRHLNSKRFRVTHPMHSSGVTLVAFLQEASLTPLRLR